MKKLIFSGFFIATLLLIGSVSALAEESRIPEDLELTHYEGINIEPEYDYNEYNGGRTATYKILRGSAPLWAEDNKGAHYYVYSTVTSEYAEAYTRIKLPTSLNLSNENNGRNAYISLGIFGTLGNLGVDMGIRNEGSGWSPYTYDVCGKNFEVYDLTVTNAKKAVIVATPLSTTVLRLYVQFQDAKGNEISYFYQNIPVASGNFQLGDNGEVACHYYRFASLVNQDGEEDNQEDGTYMLGGNFNGLALYKRSTSTYENWGMTSSLVNQAWLVSPDHITVTYASGSDTETFSIKHK